MALDQSALLELLEALKAADVDDRIRSAASTIYQALIEAELTAVIGAAPHERTDARTADRSGVVPLRVSRGDSSRETRVRPRQHRRGPMPVASHRTPLPDPVHPGRGQGALSHRHTGGVPRTALRNGLDSYLTSKTGSTNPTEIAACSAVSFREGIQGPPSPSRVAPALQPCGT